MIFYVGNLVRAARLAGMVASGGLLGVVSSDGLGGNDRGRGGGVTKYHMFEEE